MSAISVEESEREPTYDAQIPLLTTPFFQLSKLRIFCFVPNYGIKGVILVSARTEEDARAKLDKFSDKFKYIGMAKTLQELLEILEPFKTREPDILHRKDVWNFVYDGEEFY